MYLEHDVTTYNTYETTIKNYGSFELPIPTYVINKKIDFRLLFALLLRSNNNTEDNYRYIDCVNLNINDLCKELSICRKTFWNKIKYLESVNIITLKNATRGLVMRINYSKNGKYYITLQHEIMHHLLCNLDNNTIKVYIVLKIYCDILNNKRSLTLAELCSQLGYTTNNNRNLNNMSIWTNKLEEENLIEKTRVRIYKKNKLGKQVIDRVDTYYKIIPFIKWKEAQKKSTE